MTARDFSKTPTREYRPTGDGKASTTAEEVQRILLGPDAIECRGCAGPFLTTGEEPRARPIHRCPRCRLELEEEAQLNGLPLSAADDDLTKALASIARCEARLVTAHRPRRVERLNRQIAEVRQGLWEKMSGSIWEKTA